MREPALLSRRAAAALPLAALFRPVADAVPPTTAGDAALVDLGRRWEAVIKAGRVFYASWQTDLTGAAADAQEAIGDEMYDTEMMLFDRIMGTPAMSPSALLVKAKVLLHEHDYDDLDEASIAAALASVSYLVDRAALSLALDLFRLARAAS